MVFSRKHTFCNFCSQHSNFLFPSHSFGNPFPYPGCILLITYFVPVQHQFNTLRNTLSWVLRASNWRFFQHFLPLRTISLGPKRIIHYYFSHKLPLWTIPFPSWVNFQFGPFQEHGKFPFNLTLIFDLEPPFLLYIST